MFYYLPPVGDPIQHMGCHPDPGIFRRAVSPYQYRFFASGTAALAAAIVTAKSRKSVTRPEVILPAYACPDLISAAVYAGVKPVLIDLVPERPWMDLDRLASQLSENTVAIVAVNFLGILERHAEIRSLLEPNGAVHIEDSAQAFPRKDEQNFWQGDLVVVSFGRGKPVSLLGGGALLFRDEYETHVPLVKGDTESGGLEKYKFHLKSALYNRLIHPHWYWLPEAMPGLRLGETRYHPLDSLGPIASENEHILSCNLVNYQRRALSVQQALHSKLHGIDVGDGHIIDLPVKTVTPSSRALLRYPVLVSATMREGILQQLRRAGLGASRLYPSALPSIPGIDKMPDISGEFPVAEDFSRRLVTLPTHQFVSQKDQDAMIRILQQGN